MDINTFWEIIDSVRKESDGWEDMYEPLVARLTKLETNEILVWGNILDEYHMLSEKNLLWAAAYIINGGCSDDGFMDFRGWLIVQGKKIFLEALKDPDSLTFCKDFIDSSDAEFQDIFGVAMSAYFKKMGIEEENYDLFNGEMEKNKLSDDLKKEMVSEIEYAEDIDIEIIGDEDAEKKLLPKLYKTFYEE